MRGAISNIRKSRGRPRVDATAIGLRLPPEQLRRLDAWIDAQPDQPTRPEAIRRLLESGLNAADKIPIRGRKPTSGTGGGTDDVGKSATS